MYIIINKTQNKCVKETGEFPTDAVTEFLEKGDKIVVISLYSNCVKIPQLAKDKSVSWDDYCFPDGTFRGL